jgi:hypothetical protein
MRPFSHDTRTRRALWALALAAALLGAAALPGGIRAARDTTPPGLFITLDHIPDDQNDVLVVPPGGFRITLAFDAGAGSPLDPSSLVVTASHALGGLAAGANLASRFSLTERGAVWTVPEDPGMDLTTVELSVRIRDRAGDETHGSFAFAVRSFDFGAPLATTQHLHLDFTRDRDADGVADFVESLRRFGLTTPGAPDLERRIHDELVAEIVARVDLLYGNGPEGTRTRDSVNAIFSPEAPGVPHSSLCIGGEHPDTPGALGSVPIDLDNLDEVQDECRELRHGVFPDAIETLWGPSQLFRNSFGPLRPGRGGAAVGSHPLDAVLFAPGFRLADASEAQLARFLRVLDALDLFAQVVGVGVAHEVGHMLGLTAPGPAPLGLFGGSSGDELDHNVAAGGGTPRGNHVMNRGGSFSLAEISGREGQAVPRFRPLNWAYLHDRIVRSEVVTELLPPPRLSTVEPNPASFGGERRRTLSFRGEGFAGTPVIELLSAVDGTPSPVLDVVRIDTDTVTGVIDALLVSAGVYDVRLVNADEQIVTLEGGLVVR